MSLATEGPVRHFLWTVGWPIKLLLLPPQERKVTTADPTHLEVMSPTMEGPVWHFHQIVGVFFPLALLFHVIWLPLFLQDIPHECIVTTASPTYLEAMSPTTEGPVRHFHWTIGNERHSDVVDSVN